MKNILIIGTTCIEEDAISTIFSCSLGEGTKESNITFFGYSSKNVIFQKKPNVRVVCVKSPFYGFSHLFYRIKRKMYRKFGWDDATLSSSYAYCALEKATKGQVFDCVIGVSGSFCYLECAYKYSLAHHLEFRVVLFDPFVTNPYTKNKKKRLSLESKWLSKASLIFVDGERCLPTQQSFSGRCKRIFIPIATLTHKNAATIKTLVCGGTFYRGLRDPEPLYSLSEKAIKYGFQIKVFSNISSRSTSAISFNRMIEHGAFLAEEERCFALILVGNAGPASANYFPSKIWEYISLKKPIIGINTDNIQELRKYPFYFSSNDPLLFEKLGQITELALSTYDPYCDFPNRLPSLFSDTLLE
jgi:hypothetical protein